MKKILLGLVFIVSLLSFGNSWGATHYHLDPALGNDTNNGTTWALAWKTITSGATAARIVPGDSILIAKSPDPISIGDGIWTDNSGILTLASALTANIDLCGAAWTAGSQGNVTPSADGSYEKEGTYAAKFIIASGFTTGIIAFHNLTPADFSSYDSITFWVRSADVDLAAGVLRLNLYADNDTTNLTDSVVVNHILEYDKWYPITLPSATGALGNSTNCIALMARIDPGSSTIYLDNVLACNGFSLHSLLGKNSVTESWFPIKSINGTEVNFGVNSNINTGVTKYAGSSETVTTYRRESFQTTLATSSSDYVQQTQDDGTITARIYYLGGCNTANENLQQDGETWFDGVNLLGRGLYSTNTYLDISRIGLVRYYEGVRLSGGLSSHFNRVSGCGNNYGLYLTTLTKCVFDTVVSCVNYAANLYITTSSGFNFWNFAKLDGSYGNGIYILTYSDYNIFTDVYTRSNVACGIYTISNYDLYLRNLNSTNNGGKGIDNEKSQVYVDNCLFTGSATSNLSVTNCLSFTKCNRYGQIADRFLSYYSYGNISDQITGGQDSTWAYGGIGLCVYLNPSNTSAPLMWRFKVPCTAGTAFTVSFYVKKTSSVANPTLTVGYYGSGITEVRNQSITLTDTWAQYTSASMTPTATGFVEVTLNALDGSTTGDIGVDHITISGGGYSDFGEANNWYYGLIDGGIVGDYFGEANRWYYGLIDGGITDASGAPPPPPSGGKYLLWRK